jgi:putative ABC transport system ATP-binding protein
MSLVDVRGASHLWVGAVGLHPIDLRVERGELVVVRGRSGSGKSTLLALLAGLCTPDTGDVLVDGRAPLADSPWSHIAIVPQVLALAVELSVRENITDCAPSASAAEVDALLAMLHIDELARRTINEISMGQQQRVAVARAMAVGPDLLLADEPTSFQDDAHTAVVVTALREAAAAGAGVLVATHDPAMTAAADRVVEIAAA